MIIKAPEDYDSASRPMIFLAGSIDMGKAPHWRESVAETLSDLGFGVLNPWRDDWDDSWTQSISNDHFREQVEWELDGMEDCDAILMYFAPGSTAPITLLELGAFHHKTVVCCPEGYWRKGNVDVFCSFYKVISAETLDKAIEHIAQKLRGGAL